jgi:hypothetical protein
MRGDASGGAGRFVQKAGNGFQPPVRIDNAEVRSLDDRSARRRQQLPREAQPVREAVDVRRAAKRVMREALMDGGIIASMPSCPSPDRSGSA